MGTFYLYYHCILLAFVFMCVEQTQGSLLAFLLSVFITNCFWGIILFSVLEGSYRACEHFKSLQYFLLAHLSHNEGSDNVSGGPLVDRIINC